MRVALYEPDIPQNTGAILRLGACLGFPVDIIEPAGFDLSDRALKRAALDYLPHVEMRRHESWQSFRQTCEGHRLVLLTTHAQTPHLEFSFAPRDILLFGRESSGVPQPVHDAAGARVRIPMRPGLRSLNVALSVAIVAAEALRQTARWPD
jgi:tRNA (cytidine/uridine-2'-O-)-methyltransferase